TYNLDSDKYPQPGCTLLDLSTGAGRSAFVAKAKDSVCRQLPSAAWGVALALGARADRRARRHSDSRSGPLGPRGVRCRVRDWGASVERGAVGALSSARAHFAGDA